jgi:hypothetical protein
VRSTCGGGADARRLMAVVRPLWRREHFGRRCGPSLTKEFDELAQPGVSPAVCGGPGSTRAGSGRHARTCRPMPIRPHHRPRNI